jgi:hypothetical protein
MQLNGSRFARALTAVAAYAAALPLAGCQEGGETRSDGDKTEEAAVLDPAFVTGPCADVPAWKALPAEAVVSSRFATAEHEVDILRRVTSVSGFATEHALTYVLANGRRVAMGTRAEHFGFLFAAAQTGLERRFTYTPDPSTLEHMRPGQRMAFEVTETVVDEGRRDQATHQFNVAMLGCGTLKWRGGETPVKVFRADVASSTVDRNGTIDGASQETFTAYLAPHLGWPLLKVTGTEAREEVQSIEPRA